MAVFFLLFLTAAVTLRLPPLYALAYYYISLWANQQEDRRVQFCSWQSRLHCGYYLSMNYYYISLWANQKKTRRILVTYFLLPFERTKKKTRGENYSPYSTEERRNEFQTYCTNLRKHTWKANSALYFNRHCWRTFFQQLHRSVLRYTKRLEGTCNPTLRLGLSSTDMLTYVFPIPVAAQKSSLYLYTKRVEATSNPALILGLSDRNSFKELLVFGLRIHLKVP
jgi:hypothetical protein